MLIAPCGRPLTVESREPPGVLTPARLTTKSSALRLVSGRLGDLLRRQRRRDGRRLGLDDFRAGGHDDLLLDAADFQLDGDARRHAGVDLDVVDVAVLKPGRVTVTVYLPAVELRNRELPFRVGDRFGRQAACRPRLTMTLAPGMTAPDVSVTVPDERRRGAALGECRGRPEGHDRECEEGDGEQPSCSTRHATAPWLRTTGNRA